MHVRVAYRKTYQFSLRDVAARVGNTFNIRPLPGPPQFVKAIGCLNVCRRL